ncbi:hypothetical protein [Nonomuraea dietziae]|uniref:hypothetical protein n=1 Tax=Nonomuraea dietziae TaxID=65515 RepID=UPI0031DF6EDA
MRTARRLALPARTVRVRFTALYGVLFLLSGAALLVITNLVSLGSTRISEVAPGGRPSRQELDAGGRP